MSKTNIIVGDCRQILATLPEQSIQCVVTSPPYWGQRDYGVDGMIGLEADVQTWLAVMVDVFRGVRRVLRDDGTVWLNLGDKYAGSGGAGGDYNAGGLKAEQSGTGPSASTKQSGFKQKDLMGLPWRVALALQDDGWYLRRDIIWHKPNPMPESATDRPATAHEYIFLLTKQPRYFYDADAVRTITGKEASPENYGGKGLITHPTGPERKAVDLGSGMSQTKVMPNTTHPADASLRSVWKIATQAFGGAHYATYPEKLVEPCIMAGSRQGDTILDPFSGAGTTGLVAARFDRNYIGIELNPEYAAMSLKRIADRVGVTDPEQLEDNEQAQGQLF